MRVVCAGVGGSGGLVCLSWPAFTRTRTRATLTTVNHDIPTGHPRAMGENSLPRMHAPHLVADSDSEGESVMCIGEVAAKPGGCVPGAWLAMGLGTLARSRCQGLLPA